MQNTNLYKKIYEMMCRTKAIPKDMSVAGQYKAISEAAILNEIKPLMKEFKLVLLPIGVTAKQDGKLTILETKWLLADTESGESVELMAPGNGADPQDKGSGKAWTYAYKAVLQKTFMLFSGEDTDNTYSDDLTKDIQATKADETKLKRVVELFDQMDEKFQAAVLKGYKIKDIERLPIAKYDDAINAMVKKLDTV